MPEQENRSGNSASAEQLEVVPLKNYGRMIVAGVVVLLAAAFAYALITSPNLQWDAVGKYLFHPSILRGVVLTVQLTVIAMVIGIILGIIFAIMKMSSNKILVIIANGYLWFFRGTPQLIQLIFWYNLAFLFPTINLGFVSWETNALITPFVAAVIGLSLNEGAYMAEIIRGGILGVSKGQREAATALGFTPLRMMRKIILPQAVRMIIPPTGNQAIALLKVTSLVSVISARDLLTNAQTIYASNYLVIELLIVASIWYLALTTVSSFIQSRIEKRFESRITAEIPKKSRSVVKRLTQVGA